MDAAPNENNIADFNERLRRKTFSDAINEMGGMYEQASEIYGEYLHLMQQNQIEAVKRLLEFVGKSRRINNLAYEGWAGGPNQDWIAPLFNVLGAVYPDLSKEARRMGLERIMNYLDGLRYDYSQNHVELIDDSWLFADIVGNRPLYFPGVESYANLFEKHKTWAELSANLKYIKSPFLFSLTITLPEYTSLDIRTNFYKRFPDSVDRTADGIVARIALIGIQHKKLEGEKLCEYVEIHFKDYDPLIHDKLRAKFKEEKWVALDSCC